MQAMSEEERVAYVADKEAERTEVKRRISELYRKRKDEVAVQTDAGEGLDSRIESALDSQL